nr:hypothetical protein [Bradyrhizobium sp.]
MLRMLRQECRQRGDVLDLLEIVAAIGAGRPGKNRKRECKLRRQRGDRDVGAAIEPQDAWKDAARDAGQPGRDRVAGGMSDPRGIVDHGLAERCGQPCGLRQHGCALVGVRDQVDDDVDLADRGLVRLTGPQEDQRVGVVIGILEQVLGRRVAGKGRVQRQHAKIRRRLRRGPPDQRPEARGLCVGRPRGLHLTELLPDRTGPVEAVGVARVERAGRCEMCERRFHLVQLEADLAELMPKLAVLRPLLGELRQQRPGDQELPGRHQGMHQVGPRWPMRGIDLQRLLIEGDRVLRQAGLQVRIAEIAPAAGEGGRQPQRGLVVLGGGIELPADHMGVAELRMQRRDQLDGARGRIGRSGLEPAPIGRDRLLDPAG